MVKTNIRIMKTDMFEKIKDFLDSEEGEKSMEEFTQKIINEQKHNDRWVEKFKKYCGYFKNTKAGVDAPEDR